MSAVSPVVTIPVPPESVFSGQPATVVISIIAVPEIANVQVSLPSKSAQEPSHSAVGVTSDNVTFEFSSVNRSYDGAYTVNFTNAVGSGTVDFQLTVYC